MRGRRKQFVCTVPGCDLKHYALGVCNAHYKRLRSFGDVRANRPVSRALWGPDHRNWKGDDVGYGALHERVRRRRGEPDRCEHRGLGACSGRYNWALNWDAVGNVKHDHRTGQPFSPNPDDYIRLCHSHHVVFDHGRSEVVA